MAKNPIFPLYGQDFLTDTSEFKPNETGVYIKLLISEWINGSLPDDLERLAQQGDCKPDEFNKIWKIINYKFQKNGNGRLINKRLEEVRKEQEEYKRKKSEAGKQGGNPNFQKGKSNPYYQTDNQKDKQDNNHKHKPSISSSISSSNTKSNSYSIKELQKFYFFEDFWKDYPVNAKGRKPEKKKAEDQFKKIKTIEELEKLKLGTQQYAIEQNSEFIKHAFRFIRDKTYLDYLSKAKPKSKMQQTKEKYWEQYGKEK